MPQLMFKTGPIIALATGADAQVAQAFELEVVKTATQRNADAEAALPGGE